MSRSIYDYAITIGDDEPIREVELTQAPERPWCVLATSYCLDAESDQAVVDRIQFVLEKNDVNYSYNNFVFEIDSAKINIYRNSGEFIIEMEFNTHDEYSRVIFQGLRYAFLYPNQDVRAFIIGEMEIRSTIDIVIQ